MKETRHLKFLRKVLFLFTKYVFGPFVISSLYGIFTFYFLSCLFCTSVYCPQYTMCLERITKGFNGRELCIDCVWLSDIVPSGWGVAPERKRVFAEVIGPCPRKHWVICTRQSSKRTSRFRKCYSSWNVACRETKCGEGTTVGKDYVNIVFEQSYVCQLEPRHVNCLFKLTVIWDTCYRL